MVAILCVIIFVIGIAIDQSLCNIYEVLDRIANELEQLRK